MARNTGEVCLETPPASEGGRTSDLRPIRRVRTEPTDASSGVDYVEFGESGERERMAVLRMPKSAPSRVLGRYLLGDSFAAGGMATVHLGRLLGAAGFSRTVAVKRMHAHLSRNHELVQRFIDEARIASRIRHANVVQTLDIVAEGGELLLVLDYVHGESLARLRRMSLAAGIAIPPPIASAIVVGVLRGLHAAHEAKSANGAPLGCVHRDVSPQNILVGADGVARVLDFGIAKAAGRLAESLTRSVKGKLAYMSPQQIGGQSLDRRADIFAAGVVLWEALAGERLFRGEDAAQTIDAVYHREVPPLADRGLGIGPAVDAVLAQALAKDVDKRFTEADTMARALEMALPPAHEREVADWVERVGRDAIAERAAKVASFERDGAPPAAASPAAKKEVAKKDLDATFSPPARAGRRDALVPPPMARPSSGDDPQEDTDPEIAPPVSLIARPVGGFTVRREEELPRANAQPPAAESPSSSSASPQSRTERVPSAASGLVSVRTQTCPVPRPLTPLVMISPPRAPDSSSPMTMSTPPVLSSAAPMSLSMPASGVRPTVLRLIGLVVAPPLAVAAVICLLMMGRGTTSARAVAEGAEAPPPPTMNEPTPPVMTAPPVVSPPTPPATPTAAAPPSASTSAKTAPPKVPPPSKRGPKPARPSGARAS